MRCSFQFVPSQALFETLYEFSPDAIVVTDSQGVIGSINAQVERVFGYAREELLGQPVEILISERFRSMHPGHRQSFNTRASV
jgi:PAS domain S-box-containing protein